MTKKTKPKRKTSNDYWINRALKREQESYLMGQELNKALLEKYRGASSEIRKLITDFYIRYAKENHLTYDEAVRIINQDEYKEFKKSLDEYVQEYTSESNPKKAAILKAKVDAMAYRSRITRLEAVNTQIECTIDKLYLESVNELNKGFEKVFKNSFKDKMLDILERLKGPKDIEELFTSTGIGFTEKFIDDKIVKDVISYPWCGNHFSDRLWKNKENLIFNMRDILSRGLLQGTSLPQMANELAEKTGQSYKAAYNLVESETTHFHEEANFRAYEAAGIEKYQFWSEHEMSTCSECASLDMQVFDVKDRKEGINAPPMHNHCRCITVEYDPDEKEDYINSGLEPPKERETWKEWYDGQVKKRGKEAVEADMKMYRNKSADNRQYEEYKNVLGAKNMPKNLAEFQKLKYNDSEGWESVKSNYSDEILRVKLRSEETPKILEMGKQGKHLKGHNNYIVGRSYLTISSEEAQELIDKYAGTGEIKRNSKGIWQNKEVITVNKDIGVNVDIATNKETATNRFVIHYSKKGVHIVPTKRSER